MALPPPGFCYQITTERKRINFVGRDLEISPASPAQWQMILTNFQRVREIWWFLVTSTQCLPKGSIWWPAFVS
jgi:hypothetical protein